MLTTRMDRLKKEHDELWLEVDRWRARGWQRLLHPSLRTLLRSCKVLLRSVAAIREELRRGPQVEPIRATDPDVDVLHTSLVPAPVTTAVAPVSNPTLEPRLTASIPALFVDPFYPNSDEILESSLPLRIQCMLEHELLAPTPDHTETAAPSASLETTLVPLALAHSASTEWATESESSLDLAPAPAGSAQALEDVPPMDAVREAENESESAFTSSESESGFPLNLLAGLFGMGDLEEFLPERMALESGSTAPSRTASSSMESMYAGASGRRRLLSVNSDMRRVRASGVAANRTHGRVIARRRLRGIPARAGTTRATR